MASTSAMTAIAISAGTRVRLAGWSVPTRPANISSPRIATATKLTELLIRKNATDRRAIRSPSIPPSCRTQAPSASPPMPLAGTSEPIASSEPPICQLRRQLRPRQKIGANITT